MDAVIDLSNRLGHLGAEIEAREVLVTDLQSRAGNAESCEICDKPLQPKSGSRRQRFCCDAHRQAAHRLKKWTGLYVDLPPSRSVSADRSVETVESIEADLIAGLGDLRDLEPKRRDYWRRRARLAAESIVAIHPTVPTITPVTINSTTDPAIKAKADELIATIPSDLSIPDFLRRTDAAS